MNLLKNNIITSLSLLIFIFLSIVLMRGSINFNNRHIRVYDAYNLGDDLTDEEKHVIINLESIYYHIINDKWISSK